jgi:hypothetical protein
MALNLPFVIYKPNKKKKLIGFSEKWPFVFWKTLKLVLLPFWGNQDTYKSESVKWEAELSSVEEKHFRSFKLGE